ncbi:hypothetical protein XENORESO_017389 [Xenotaenia resolanae]|uniref:Uncharacterized protein n=1 Tax=Xenotaenia resolanae TaxID=208358 RepID=A0ABV0WM18_9TELE
MLTSEEESASLGSEAFRIDHHTVGTWLRWISSPDVWWKRSIHPVDSNHSLQPGSDGRRLHHGMGLDHLLLCDAVKSSRDSRATFAAFRTTSSPGTSVTFHIPKC